MKDNFFENEGKEAYNGTVS